MSTGSGRALDRVSVRPHPFEQDVTAEHRQLRRPSVTSVCPEMTDTYCLPSIW
jgi:hypothetical protein